jgi:hypothetical protein
METYIHGWKKGFQMPYLNISLPNSILAMDSVSMTYDSIASLKDIQNKVKWSINTWAERYQRIDTRIAYPFRWSGVRGEVAWIIQSLNGAHFEYKAYNDPADRIVERRQWVTLRLDY